MNTKSSPLISKADQLMLLFARQQGVIEINLQREIANRANSQNLICASSSTF